MAITFFGHAPMPADGSAAVQAGPGPITITPPASMTVGDLCIVIGQYRGAESFSVANAGGQSWNTLAERNATNQDTIVWWCRFNGTWSANPQFQIASGTVALTFVMIVFRPTDTGKLWAIDVAQDEQDFVSGSTPFTKTMTGRSVSANTITLASWFTADDNTWGTLSGTGWSKTGLSAQYRNTTGTDQSQTHAYHIDASAGSVPNVSQNQATLGGDAGTGGMITWQEQTPLVQFAGIGAALSTGAGALRMTRALAAAEATLSAGTAVLNRQLGFAGAAASISTGAAVLIVTRPLVAAAASLSTGAGALDRKPGLVAAAASLSVGAGVLDRRPGLSGAGATVSTGSASLTVTGGAAVAFAGIGAALSAGSGSLRAARPLSAAGNALSTGAGVLDRRPGLACAIATISTGAGVLGIARLLSATVATLSTGAGAFTILGTVALSGICAAISAGAGILDRKPGLSGAAASLFTGSGALLVARGLNGIGATLSSGQANLTIDREFRADSITAASAMFVANSSVQTSLFTDDDLTAALGILASGAVVQSRLRADAFGSYSALSGKG